MIIQGNIVDLVNRQIFKGEIVVENGQIRSIEKKKHTVETFILPGFIDAHIHIESSMLVPSEFARVAVTHGTVATVSDPHEIANVLGVDGVKFMIENGKQVPLKFHFGAPSCVPATSFESAGAVIDSEGVKELLGHPDIFYLAEMMNYPGVIYDDDEVLKKLQWAQVYKKPVDGHAPGLRGEQLSKYIAAGITTDHECFTWDEALEKLQKGMKILIREGSAAKNFEALIGLAEDHFEHMMFCSDDKHPDDLLLGHINQLCARAIAKGVDVFKVLQMACINPIEYYNLKVGRLRVSDPADFIVVEDLTNFKVLQTYINGQLVSENGRSHVASAPFNTPNQFMASKKLVSDFIVPHQADKIRVIEALDGELVTKELIEAPLVKHDNIISNIPNDILKMAMVNRYQDDNPALGFITNFGLKHGAIASSVGHDSHNIIAVGADDASLCRAVNLIIENQGGICVVLDDKQWVMPLPVAGIMSDQDAETVGKAYQQLDLKAKELGSPLSAPFMTLSFMGLLVIPSLKLSDKGLFNGDSFQFTSVFCD